MVIDLPLLWESATFGGFSDVSWSVTVGVNSDLTLEFDGMAEKALSRLNMRTYQLKWKHSWGKISAAGMLFDGWLKCVIQSHDFFSAL